MGGMGPLHCADRREEGEEGVTRRWFGAAVLVLVAAACNGDNDDAVESSVAETTVPANSPPETTEVTTTTESTTTTVEATTTTLDEEALKAQIAEDFLEAEQVLEDVGRNPDPATFREEVAAAVVPGSELYQSVVSSIDERLATGERFVPGDPDYSDAFVESVDLIDGPSSGRAEVTACFVTNQLRVGPNGEVIGGSGLFAARLRQPMQATASGWLHSSPAIRIDIREDVTSCDF